MSIACLFGRHRPSLTSIQRRGTGYVALCDHCARPLEREAFGKWIASEPLDVVKGQPTA